MSETTSEDNRAPLVRVIDLHKWYMHSQNKIEVLTGLNLDIYPREMISITGASGVGKTTLLQVLGTLDNPNAGQILFDNVNPFSLADGKRARFRRHNIGFIFQFHHLLPQFTALENVAMPARIDRIPTVEAEKRARGILDRMGLSHRLRHRPTELSGGEQQRVAVARALINRPRVILADEPTGNLDVKTGAGIHDLLVELNTEFGIAMVIVTHNPALALRMPRQLELKDGVVVPQQTVAHVTPEETDSPRPVEEGAF